MFYLSYFNTSHVTVYLIRLSTISLTSIFQYISCYCLSILVLFHSENEFISIHLMLLFIKLVVRIIGLSVHFNTSHVTVYRITVTQFKANLCISIHLMLLFIGLGLTFTDSSLNFNTSHVTVYLIVRDTALFKISISIHLMLLFIV